jgi:hypothetical protein
MFLALGCYISINQNKFSQKNDKIFQGEGKDGLVSNTYSKILLKLIKDEEQQNIVFQHCRKGHFHPHVLEKRQTRMLQPSLWIRHQYLQC